MTSAMSRRHRPGCSQAGDFASLHTLEAGPPRALRVQRRKLPMTSALHMSLVPLFSALLLASPAAAGRHPRNVAAQKPDDAGECLRLAERDGVANALGSLGPASEDRELGSVRFSGAG